MTITVYSKPSCVQCTATYRALDRAGLSYDVVDLSADEQALAQVLELGYQQAPVVFADDEHYRALLDAEEAVRTELWAHEQWRRIRVDDGKTVEDTSQEDAATFSLRRRQLHARTDDACLAS